MSSYLLSSMSSTLRTGGVVAMCLRTATGEVPPEYVIALSLISGDDLLKRETR